MESENSLSTNLSELNIDSPEISENTKTKLFNSLVKIEKTDEVFAQGFFMKANINNKDYNFLVISDIAISIDYVERMETINISF